MIAKYPIEILEAFRRINASNGKYYRIRYRGPRNTALDKGRGRMNRASTCLKANAVYFAVYEY
jgi:hypothetical protein